MLIFWFFYNFLLNSFKFLAFSVFRPILFELSSFKRETLNYASYPMFIRKILAQLRHSPISFFFFLKLARTLRFLMSQKQWLIAFFFLVFFYIIQQGLVAFDRRLITFLLSSFIDSLAYRRGLRPFLKPSTFYSFIFPNLHQKWSKFLLFHLKSQ